MEGDGDSAALGPVGFHVQPGAVFAQTPRTPLFVLIAPEAGFIGQLTGGLFIYREGILYGAVQGLRSASMLALGLLVCWTSDPRQLLQALLAWRLPPQMAFMLVTAIRFCRYWQQKQARSLQRCSCVATARADALLFCVICRISPSHFWRAA